MTWYEVVYQTKDNTLGIMLAIGKGMSPLVIVVAAETVVLVEGYAMLAEKYLKRRYAEGRAEGCVEGRVEKQALWKAWNNRRLEAEARGEPFDEPTPSDE